MVVILYQLYFGCQVKKPAAKKKDEKKFNFELGVAAKGLSPPVLQSTPTTGGEPAQADVLELPLLSTSSSSSDDGVLLHPSPKVSTCRLSYITITRHMHFILL